MGDNVSYHSFSLASNLGGSKNSPVASCYENRLLIRRHGPLGATQTLS